MVRLMVGHRHGATSLVMRALEHPGVCVSDQRRNIRWRRLRADHPGTQCVKPMFTVIQMCRPTGDMLRES
jgi:hypothetical protein